VVVDDSSNYYELTSPAITPINDLSTMAGFHFRGFVHLQAKADVTDPDTEGISPINALVNVTPDFFVRTNYMPGIYSASALEQIKVYAISLETGAYTTLTAPATGGLGVRRVSGMSPLATEGSYFWVSHQNFNGSVYTAKPATAYNWTFSSLPSSGATEPLSFIYDTTAPTTNAVESILTQSATGSSAIAVKVKVGIMDTTSGVATSTLYVLDNTATVVARVEVPLANQLDYLAINLIVSLAQSQVYSFFNVVTDAAGNTSTSSTLIFSTPSVSSLIPPVFGPSYASDVRSNQATLNSTMYNTGGSIVTSVGTCWVLNPTLFTAATNSPGCMQSAPSATGYGVYQIFRDTHLGLPASTSISYRSFATNGSGTSFSPILSTTTLNLASATTTNPATPIIGAIGVSSTTADSAKLISRLEASGGAPVTSYGFCWALASTSLPATPTSASSCYRTAVVLPSTATLPYWFVKTFDLLPANTLIHYRAYVGNSVGTSTATGSFTTQAAWLDFELLDYSISSVFDDNSKTYTLTLPFTPRDLSSYRYSVPVSWSSSPVYFDRSLPYTVTLEDLSGNIIETQTGMITTFNQYTAPNSINITFNSVAPSGYVVVRPVINQPEGSYIESFGSTTARLNNVKPKILNLIDPDLAEDIVSGSGGGSGPSLPDPGIEIVLDTEIIRSGSESLLTWDTKVNYPMSCEIIGPSSFGTNGLYTFDPSVSGSIGSVSTGPLSSAQIFELECYEAITDSTFNTTKRIDVAGKLQER
jgi:hypothetical protein